MLLFSAIEQEFSTASKHLVEHLVEHLVGTLRRQNDRASDEVLDKIRRPQGHSFAARSGN